MFLRETEEVKECANIFSEPMHVWPWWMFTERLDFLKVHRFSIDIKLSSAGPDHSAVHVLQYIPV